MPRELLSKESLDYLSKAHLVHGRRVLSVSSYSSDSTSSQATIDLPDHLYSYDTLIFCDFNSTVASHIIKGYESAVAAFGEDSVDFREIIKNVIECSRADVCFEDNDWETALFELGANPHLINRILDPFWKDVRLCRTAKEWLWFVVDSRLAFLESLNSSIRAHGQKSQPRQAKTSVSASHGASSSSSTSKSLKLPPSGFFAAPSQLKVATSTQETDTPAENSQVFYKGDLMHRLRSSEGPNKKIFPSLTSTPPGDFHALVGGLYLSKHRQVAWEYAQMAAHFVDGRHQLPVGILSISIPVDLLANAYTVVGDEWRSYVWSNRRVELDHLEPFIHLEEYHWLQGPVCSQATGVVERLSSKEEITPMKFENTTADQIWTGKPRMLIALQERAQPTIRVEEIHPGPQKR
jgi:hypothetical protein